MFGGDEEDVVHPLVWPNRDVDPRFHQRLGIDLPLNVNGKQLAEGGVVDVGPRQRGLGVVDTGAE